MDARSVEIHDVVRGFVRVAGQQNCHAGFGTGIHEKLTSDQSGQLSR